MGVGVKFKYHRFFIYKKKISAKDHNKHFSI